jgi:uncharacterized membrane protein YqhA
MDALKKAFEWLLWQSRRMVVVGVLTALLLAAGSIYLATVDAVRVLGVLVGYASPDLVGDARISARGYIVTGVVKAMDGYLIGAIMIVFALGLYELFVARFQADSIPSSVPKVFRIHTLDDLKERLSKVVVLLLAVEFLQRALQLGTSTLDLLYFGLAILAVGITLFVTSGHAHKAGDADPSEHAPDK